MVSRTINKLVAMAVAAAGARCLVSGEARRRERERGRIGMG